MMPFQTPTTPVPSPMLALAAQAQQPPQMPTGAPMPQGGGMPPQGAPVAPPPPPMNKQQVIAGIHHFSAVQKQMKKVLASPTIGHANARPAIADATAQLMIDKILTLPEAMNALKLVPTDPGEQKAWVMKAVMNAEAAQKKIVADYIAQGPGPEPDSEHGPWSPDSHKNHMDTMMGRYRK